MPAFPVIPLFSREDPEQSSEGGLDPLGMAALSESLAGKLVPGVRERMSRARFLTAVAVSREVCRDCDTEAPGLESWLAFELYLVEALVRGSRGVDSSQILGLPGSQKGAAAVDSGLPLATRRYLKTPSVFGVHGVYKTLATALNHERDEMPAARGSELAEIWAREQGLTGFTGGSGPGSDFRRLIATAVEETRAAMETRRSAAWRGWKLISDHLHPNQLGRREAAFLRDGILQDQRGFRGEVWSYFHSPRGRAVSVNLLRDGVRQVNERDFHEALAENASCDLREWLAMITAFESFARLVMNAWLRLLGDLARENAPRDAAWLGHSIYLKDIARRLPEVWRKCDDQWKDEALYSVWRQRFHAFAEPCSSKELVERLVAHHRSIQRAKAPTGKRPWVDDAGGGRLSARQLYSDLEEPAVATRYVHAYRFRPLVSLKTDLDVR